MAIEQHRRRQWRRVSREWLCGRRAFEEDAGGNRVRRPSLSGPPYRRDDLFDLIVRKSSFYPASCGQHEQCCCCGGVGGGRNDVEASLARCTRICGNDVRNVRAVSDRWTSVDSELSRKVNGHGRLGIVAEDLGYFIDLRARYFGNVCIRPTGHASHRKLSVLAAALFSFVESEGTEHQGGAVVEVPAGHTVVPVVPTAGDVICQSEFRCDGLGLPVRNDDFGRRILHCRKPRRQRGWCCCRILWARLGRFDDRDPLVSAGRFRCQFGYSPQH